MDNNAKLRPLYLAKILYERTDEDHYLTTMQLAQILEEEYGIPAHRQTIKTDIELLQQFGMDIQEVKSTQNRYNLISRQFEIAELKLLIDAVQSSKFISKERSEQMVSKIVTLAGQHKAEELKRNASVEGRVKSENRQDLLIVDAINEAINARKKIAFQYFAYNIRKQKKLRHDGERYIFSPYRLIWNGDYYYVLGYSDKHQAIGSFRVDRISARPDILSEEAVPVPVDFGVDDFLATTFRMYGSECREVELICDNSVIDAIIDRFGTDVTIYACDMSTFRVIVRVAISHIFFSWIFGFGGKVRIKGPEKIKTAYRNDRQCVSLWLAAKAGCRPQANRSYAFCADSRVLRHSASRRWRVFCFPDWQSNGCGGRIYEHPYRNQYRTDNRSFSACLRRLFPCNVSFL